MGGIGLEAGAQPRWRVQIAAVGAQLDVVWLLFVAHNHEARGVSCDLQRLSDDGGDELPTVGDRIRLEDCQILIIQWCESRRVLVPEHGEDTRQRPRGARVDRHDAAPGDRALHREDVGHARDRVLVGIFRRASDFQ